MEWQDDIEAWRGSVESRLESVEEISRLVPELIERLGPQTLSTEHQASVQAVVKRMHEISDVAFGAVYSDLNQAFHVATYKDIPESRWEDVAEWLRRRVEGASRPRQRATRPSSLWPD
jgi:hypothetical protein